MIPNSAYMCGAPEQIKALFELVCYGLHHRQIWLRYVLGKPLIPVTSVIRSVLLDKSDFWRGSCVLCVCVCVCVFIFVYVPGCWHSWTEEGKKSGGFNISMYIFT